MPCKIRTCVRCRLSPPDCLAGTDQPGKIERFGRYGDRGFHAPLRDAISEEAETRGASSGHSSVPPRTQHHAGREYAPSPREFFICLSRPGPATIPDTRLFLSEGRFISPANSSTAAGFDAIWGSGFEPSVSSVVPDANILPVDTHLELMRTTGEVQDAPVIADIDTGCRRDAGDSRAHSTLQNTVDASSGPAAA